MTRSKKDKNAKWRVAVVDYFHNKGKGGHGTHTAFLGLPGVEICAVCDPDRESRSPAPFRTRPSVGVKDL